MTLTTVMRTLSDRLGGDGWRAALRQATHGGAPSLRETSASDEPSFPLRAEDVHDGTAVAPVRGRPADRLRIGWVCSPPSPGSGEHTTLFRMVRALEKRGHECTLVLYDPHAEDVSHHEAVIRRGWPGLTARIASASAGLDGYDAVVASSWPTAHVVAVRNSTAVPFYFIQDYEPFFHPRGYTYDLAESTYGFGLLNIALGGMVAQELEEQAGTIPEVVVPLGCDTTSYRLLSPEEGDTTPRRGIVYAAQRTADRRGYLLVKAALEHFHRLCPDEPIHIVGDTVSGWTIPVVQHGWLPPAEVNRIYNSTIASLAVSFTNLSPAPGEMLAAGNIPVLNDLPGPRLDLDSPHAVWAPGTPQGLAEAMARLALSSDVDITERAREAAGSPQPSWSVAQEMIADYIEARGRRGTMATSRGQTVITRAPSCTRDTLGAEHP